MRAEHTDDSQEFYCPKCGNKANINHAVSKREYSTRSLVLPYFTCHECRTCYYSKRLIRHLITFWRDDDNSRYGAKSYPFKQIYNEMIKFMEQIMAYAIDKTSYRLVKFVKK